MPPKLTGASNDTESHPASAVVDTSGYDSDEPPPDITTKQDRLLWRQDPKESHSDWAIVLIYLDNNGKEVARQRKVYHVHKLYLTTGPRRSEWFNKYFGDSRRNEVTASTTELNVETLAAVAFPHVLDYLYSVEAELEIDTQSASALYWWGTRLEMRRLQWTAKQFWKQDMTSLANCELYYNHGVILDTAKVVEAAALSCASHISKVDESSPLLRLSNESFWMTLLQANKTKLSLSMHISKLLACYFDNCGATADAFLQLTDKSLLPAIHRDAGIQLMDLERSIVGMAETALTCLQERCIKAITSDWYNFDEIPDSDMVLLQRQSPLVLTEVLVSFAKSAKKGFEECLEYRFKADLDKFASVKGATMCLDPSPSLLLSQPNRVCPRDARTLLDGSHGDSIRSTP